jgi:hypothetical protein
MHKRLQQVPPDKFSAYFTVWLWISYPYFRVAGAALIMQYDSCDARQMSDQVRRVGVSIQKLNTTQSQIRVSYRVILE